MAPKQRAVHVSLRNVTPVGPENEEERKMLQQDLHGMGCEGFLERPWNLKNEEFVQEFVMIRERKGERKAEQSNIFDATIHDRLEEWTVGMWREVYEFLPEFHQPVGRWGR